ncbi:MAG: Holliday junction branch migration protein RuvA [Anaerolineae bacterium]|nr:Holliday junction branch migration protein RuvA [Anaerolineae bacterium]MDW8098377.1 Holliday junction branch migration protein RuvA [Anaerolineae bacterium]
MIAWLEGRVLGRGKDYLIIQVGGMGFKAFAPAPLLAQARVGEMVTVHTHLHIRENELALFAFSSEEELAMFELLITVSGVGPRTALAALSAMAVDSLRMAITQEQPELLARIPGIGKRTAQKIVMELKDKLPAVEIPEGLATLTEADLQVVDALTALGYSVVEAQRAVQRLPREVTDVEERLRMALASFA